MTHWTQAEDAQPRIAVIGAGMSGIAAVVKLKKAGYSDVTVFVFNRCRLTARA